MSILQKIVQINNGDDMFTNYIIKDKILYLEININYEFGDFSKKRKKIIDEIKDYIEKMGIKLKKGKIVLTCSGVIIGSIILTNLNAPINTKNIKYVPNFENNITYINKTNENLEDVIKNENINIEIKEEVKVNNNTNENNSNINVNTTYTNDSSNKKINTITSDNNQNNNQSINTNQNITNVTESTQHNNINNITTTPSGPTVTVHRSNGSVITIDLEEYIVGVIAAEMPASFNTEALKAQSVIARTYALRSQSTGKKLTDTVSTQAYIDTGQMQAKWGSSYNTYYNKIKNAVESTKGQYLTYNGTYIEALYHSTNNGKTESSFDVFGNYYPYLISVTSEYDKSASSYLRTTTIDLNTISSKLGINLTGDSIIEILSYTDGLNIKQINIAGSTFTGRQVREALGLRSADFDIVINENTANITTRGFGHGVGMSQYGANGMANAGYGYQNILSHYYPGTTLKK